MKISVTRKAELSTKRWSGGATTQLAIWPENADYGARRFDWRMSSAAVEDERSVFTPLPGIRRLLMIIDGKITVEHDGEPAREMLPLSDVDDFDGGSKTVSVGRCTDFNLMLAAGWHGAIGKCAQGGEILQAAQSSAEEYWRGIYALVDGLAVKIAASGEVHELQLNSGDFLLFSCSPAKDCDASISLSCGSDAVPAVWAEVWR